MPAACGANCTQVVTKFGYDTQDHLTSVTDHGTVANPNGLTTNYKVDDEGWTLRETSPDRGITNYTYDEAGNLKTKTNANGTVETHAYDALNLKELRDDAKRVLEKNFPKSVYLTAQSKSWWKFW